MTIDYTIKAIPTVYRRERSVRLRFWNRKTEGANGND
jgi:hypothetical protein